MEFRILGPLEVLDGERRVAIGGAKPRTLLGVLLLHAGQTVPVDRLIDELWGEAPPETAGAALQVHVSSLRKALGRQVIAHRPPGYVLELDGHDLDLRRFEHLVAEARRADAATGAGLLGEALALWRGEPEVGAGRLGELRRAALEARIDAELELGHAAAVIPELQALVEEEPLREPARARLVLALYRADRQADALAELARAREVLVEELGVEPGAELRRLQRAILEQDPTLTPGAPAPGGTPLPTPAVPLLGRAAELEALHALLRAGARLVTLTGPGGIGKTRLALEAVRAFDPSAVFVPLDALEDPSLVPAAVARALGVDAARRSPEEAVAGRLRVVPATVLLDNFEQVLAAAPFVSACLAAAPEARFVVTSRALLRLAGEREFAVPPLDAAVELFVARAGVPVDDLDAVRAICDRLDRIPLAIELAAARASLLPPRALLDRLGSSLFLLTAGTRDAPARQRTMRDAIGWSFQLLEPAEQRVFARLAVFHGGASVEAAERVCDDDESPALDLLASLVENSLVHRVESRGEPRLRMLETVREYAADELARLEGAEDVRRRHLAWCLELVAGADRGLEGATQGEWLELLDLELPNLRAALAWAIESRDGAAALALAGATRRYWHVRGHHEEGRRWFERVLELGGGEPGPESIAWTGLGILLGDQGDYGGAEQMFERALELSRGIDEPARICSALNNLGVVSLFQGRAERAAELYLQAYETAMAHGLYHPAAFSLENMGCARLLLDDVDGAIRSFQGGLEMMRAAGEVRAGALVEGWLACALVRRGDLDDARDLLVRSLPVVQGFGFRQGIAGIVGFVATYALAAGSAEASARLVGAAGAVWTQAGAQAPYDVQMQLDRAERELRSTLGDDAFERAAAEGRSLDHEQAVALAEAALTG